MCERSDEEKNFLSGDVTGDLPIVGRDFQRVSNEGMQTSR